MTMTIAMTMRKQKPMTWARLTWYNAMYGMHIYSEKWPQHKTLPKVQRTRGLSSYQRISIVHQLQNLNQTSASQLNLKLKSWPNLASEYRPRFNFIASTKHQWQNSEQTPTSKSWLNFNFKSLTNPFAQSLNKSLALGPNVSSHICNNPLQTWSSASTSATVTTSTSCELASLHARVASIKFTKRYGVS